MKNDINLIFGEGYIKFCTWLVWGVLITLMIVTVLNVMYKHLIILGALVILAVNGLYMLYCFGKYKYRMMKKASR